MYPMLNGISGLLEPGILGSFETPQHKYVPWALNDAGVVVPQQPRDTRPIAPVRRDSLPVAVLIGPHTASSGEFTAMSFEGRANTRFFGAPTAGYVTGNVPITLPDGALILMTGSWGVDRSGKRYLDRIEPDQRISFFDELIGKGIMNSAVKWLSAQPCPKPASALSVSFQHRNLGLAAAVSFANRSDREAAMARDNLPFKMLVESRRKLSRPHRLLAETNGAKIRLPESAAPLRHSRNLAYLRQKAS